MRKTDQARALVESAATLFHRQGYGATGAREIAVAAGVPRGSFTNHFRSKEALAIEALNLYFDRLSATMEATLNDPSRPGGERLLAYVDRVGECLRAAEWQRGCLVPDLATEAATIGDALRERLRDVFEKQSAAFERALTGLALEPGDADMAAFLLAAWHGTLLRMKADRTPEALERYRRVLCRILRLDPEEVGRGS